MHYISDAGVAGKVERNIPEVYAADGQWHSVLLEKNGSATILSVDRTHSRDILHATQDFSGLNVITISLGGIPSSQPFKSTAAGTSFFHPKYCNSLSVISVHPSFAIPCILCRRNANWMSKDYRLGSFKGRHCRLLVPKSRHPICRAFLRQGSSLSVHQLLYFCYPNGEERMCSLPES